MTLSMESIGKPFWKQENIKCHGIILNLVIAEYASTIGRTKGAGAHDPQWSIIMLPNSPFSRQAAQRHRGIVFRAYATA